MRYLPDITVGVVPGPSVAPDTHQMLLKSLLSGFTYNPMYMEDKKVSTDEGGLERNRGDIGCPSWRESAND